ncbi:hypothetical protein JHK85_011166 [Glycine max]|nr:hypothetical protein JHK85_011166 [Glycine max]
MGCYKVILDCSVENKAFYEKRGFQQKSVQMAVFCLNSTPKIESKNPKFINLSLRTFILRCADSSSPPETAPYAAAVLLRFPIAGDPFPYNAVIRHVALHAPSLAFTLFSHMHRTNVPFDHFTPSFSNSGFTPTSMSKTRLLARTAPPGPSTCPSNCSTKCPTEICSLGPL